MNQQDEELEQYGETGIYSADKKIPPWLKLFYLILPVWGIIWWFLFWNGATGWLDRGSWNELEQAANTQFPLQNANQPEELSNK